MATRGAPRSTARTRIGIDLRPLTESRTFRFIWFGSLMSGVGSRFTTIAMVWPVKDLTDEAIAGPAWMSLSRLLVRQELLGSAAALDQVSFNISFVGGPSLAVIGTSGVAWAFLLDTASVVVALVLSVSAGALPRVDVQGRTLAGIIAMVFRMSILQTGTPPEMMGRIMGVGMSVWAAGPQFGAFEAGAFAALTTVDTSIFVGGVASVVGVWLLAYKWPAFRRFDVREHRARLAAAEGHGGHA